MSDIVERLRLSVTKGHEPTDDDAIDALAEIERLRQLVKTLAEADPRHDLYQQMYAENERLRAALKPFADAADTLSSFPDDTRLDLAPITLGNLRDARRALDGERRDE